MVDCRCADVEVLPNFFSITFISLNDYLRIFSDCVNDKGKAIPLVQKLKVEDIKHRLETVKNDCFYITDKDDKQLFKLVEYLNSMKGKGVNIYTYNGLSYDNLMIAGFLMNVFHYKTTKELIEYLYNLSKKIINNQNNKDYLKNDFEIGLVRKYKLPYIDVDLMRIFALNKAGVRIDKNTGERVATPKGLKQTSINLQWFELLEYELPPICEKDIELYYKNNLYKGLPIDKVNELVDKWDRYIIDEYIPDMMHYNKNDVFICCEIVRLNSEEVKSRYAVSNVYGVNVLNSSRSNMADILFEKFYSERSGLSPKQWKGKKTERTAMKLSRVIFDNVQFKTPYLKEFLERIKKKVLYRISKEEFNEILSIGNVKYSMGTGGLHSQDIPMEIWSTSDYGMNGSIACQPPTGEKNDAEPFTLIHWDINSMYPSIMSAYSIYPEHMVKSVFVGLITWMKDTRVSVKHSTEEFVNGIPKDVLALVLKIVINSIYGKLGFEKSDIYDRLAVLKVTINGQLLILMLIEELFLNNIKVISANTDGLMVIIKDSQWDLFNTIAAKWENDSKLKADADIVHCLIARDVNNYCALFRTKKGLKTEYKGAMNPFMYAIDLQKGYDMPIVAKAVNDYFINNIPVMDTLRNATNILDFCKTQNVGSQYHVEQTLIVNREIKRIPYQRYIRFYISNNGCIVEKVHNINNSRTSLASNSLVTIINTLDDTDIAFRNIDYKYYFEEAMKIINPIKLRISAKGKGKTKIKKAYGQFENLFDNNDLM